VLSKERRADLIGAGGDFPAEHGMVERLFDEVQALDAVDAVLAVDTLFYLPTDLLVKMDITSMANSLEARSPFLDHRLVEFAARLPSSFKLRRLTTKYLLKRTLRGIVPFANLQRSKRGFAVPIGRWLRTELRDVLSDHLLSSRLAQHGLLRQEALDALIGAHLRLEMDCTHQLWALLMLELWYRASLNHPAHAPDRLRNTSISTVPLHAV
jgi:asparagine synthase (glutamine-hydrolysing)